MTIVWSVYNGAACDWDEAIGTVEAETHSSAVEMAKNEFGAKASVPKWAGERQ